ncbi:MAG TPA: ATP-grasp domain-containing protein [Pyrinomonadaceae bacterium]|nr:ATP-grasp domain-containing protein [Pyrinomonadaceae bacterium]
MAKRIVCIASEHKGNEFLDECHAAEWHVTLITRKKLLDEPWLWTAIDEVRTVEDDAGVEDYVRAVTNVAGSGTIDRVIGLDEFDVITAARTREHLQLPGMSYSEAIRFRDKYSMRKVAEQGGILSPDHICPLESSGINDFLDRVEPPWIVKPRHEVSAFGIRKCESRDEVWEVLNDLDRRNNWRDHPSQFLIEKFIEGDVFHVDSVVYGGKVVCAGVSQYGKPPFTVTHYGGVFTTSIVEYRSKERRELERLNKKLLKAFDYERGVTHAEFLRGSDGRYYLLEVACRVGGAYIANVLEHACGFNLWREWARVAMADDASPYTGPKTRKQYAGVALALAKTDTPDTSHYTDPEIVYRVNKPQHVGLIFHSPDRKRVAELQEFYSRKIEEDFLAVAPAKERYDD